MTLPAALHGWAPSFGQWCSFAKRLSGISRPTYLFRTYARREKNKMRFIVRKAAGRAGFHGDL